MEQIYLALGDSTAVGVGARSGGGYPDRLARRLRSRHPSLKLVNLGQSGATSSDVIGGQLPRAAKVQPRLISLAIGINDLGLQQPEEAFALNLEEIVTTLRELNAPILIAQLPDLALSPAVARLVPLSFYERRIQLYNKHVEATAARHGLTLVDLWRLSRDTLPDHPEYFSADGFHPSDAGYETWAEKMEPLALELLDEARTATA